MRQIVAGIFYFTGLSAGRVYAIEDPDGLTLIDTGVESAADKILKQVIAAGRSPSDIKRILITHAHPDHIGGLHRLKQTTNAQVTASFIERPVIQGEKPMVRPPSRLPIPTPTMPATTVDRVVKDGDILPEVMGGIQVVFTPGHTPGHIAFWQPEQRVIFCGDVIFHIPLLGLRLPIPFFTVDMAEDKRSVKRIAELNPAIVCFGHGEPLTSDTEAQLGAFVRRLGV